MSEAQTQATVKVLFFATLKDRAGVPEITLPLPGPISVAALKAS